MEAIWNCFDRILVENSILKHTFWLLIFAVTRAEGPFFLKKGTKEFSYSILKRLRNTFLLNLEENQVQ